MLAVTPVSAATIYWTSWSGNTSGSLTTPQGTISLGYSGELSGLAANYPSWSPSASYADGSIVGNAPPPSGGMIQLVGGGSTIDTVTFSAPVINPVFAIWSLGQSGVPTTFVFNTTPTFVVGGPSAEYGGGSIGVSGNTVSGVEGNGTIMFLGTYSSISWNNPSFENYYGFTVGVAAVPEPTTMTLLAFGGLAGLALRKRG
jgi:PEP-CTERM motif